MLFIEKIDEFAELFNIENKEILKPCIPSQQLTQAEEELINSGKYRKKAKLKTKEIVGCQISVDNENVLVPKIEDQEIGVCPVCYFMGAAGLMGFLRFSNFFPEGESSIIDQTNIRIDRKTGTAASGAKVEGQFGYARKIGNKIIDKWLKNWNEEDKNKRIKTLIEDILIPALQNLKVLGGQKSRGAGRVTISIL